MKHFKKFTIYMLLVLLTACSEDFIDNPPESNITVDNFYNNDEQVLAGSASLYNYPWFHFNSTFILCLDLYAGNALGNYLDLAQFENFNVNQGNQNASEGWQSFFLVVAYANNQLNAIENKTGPSVSQAVKDWTRGESLFMRALAYFYLVRTWGAVPILEDVNVYGTNEPIYRNRVEDVYTLIIRDLTEAAELCPSSWPSSEAGRVTSGAANGILAKVYLTLGDYDNALICVNKVINSGLYSLMPVYGDIFTNPNNDNCVESVFELQFVSPPQGSHWGYCNTHQAYLAGSSGLTNNNPTDGWASFVPSNDLLRDYEAGDLRRYHTVMEQGNYYPDLVTRDGGFTVENAFGGSNYVAFRKYVIGSADEYPGTGFMNTAINTHILRYADVLLMRAEAILGNSASTSEATALGDINAVRARAGLPDFSSITLDDILHERRMELVIEGDRWYDLARINRSRAIEILSNSDRAYLVDSNDPNSGTGDGKFVVPQESDFLLPIPLSESDINPLLKEAPVAYEFK